jgi:predicted dehydrogenase
MCEKPITPTAAEAVELFELAKSKGLILCVFQNRRWDADFLTLRDLIESNQVSGASFSPYWC